MYDLLAVVVISGAGFLSTSLDNLLLLIGFYGSPGYGIRSSTLAYVLAVAIVAGLAFVLGGVADAVPAPYLGYLGIIPIALGLYHLFRLVLPMEDVLEVADRGGPARFWPVLMVMLANSGDSLAVYLSIFADTRRGYEPLIVATMLAGALGICGLARWLVNRQAVSGAIRRVGRYALPVLLIAIGIYVLADTRTDTYVEAPNAAGIEVRVRHRSPVASDPASHIELKVIT